MSPGVLGKKQVKELFDRGTISNLDSALPEPDIDGSAFDLSLGNMAWELTEGQRPTTRELEKLKTKSSQITHLKNEEGEYFQFDPGKIYLVELNQHLKLPPNINGRATGKSSVGRLDVITRLLAENNTEYDKYLYQSGNHLVSLNIQTVRVQLRFMISSSSWMPRVKLKNHQRR